MTIIKIVSISILSLIAIVLMRKLNNEYASLILCFTNIAFTVFSVCILIPVFNYIEEFTGDSDLGALSKIMFKSCGITILCSVASSICRDLREDTLANHIELAGKCTLIAFSLPLIKTVFEYAKTFIS